jgi:hypothetical protein
MIAIATLVGTLIADIFRTIKRINPGIARVYNETAHTIAIVCILFVTIPQVWFGARIGNFTTHAGAIHILESMREELNTLDTSEPSSLPSNLPPAASMECGLGFPNGFLNGLRSSSLVVHCSTHSHR